MLRLAVVRSIAVALVAALMVLGAALFAATTAAQTPPSTRAATQSCLTSLPNTVAGLPPATAPVPPLRFVYSLGHDDTPGWGYAPRAHTQLVVWQGDAKGAYRGILVSFFKSPADARASLKALAGLYGGKLIGNVVVTWTQKAIPGSALRNDVLDCLTSGPAGGQAQPSPAASLATFAGAWGGHTRSLSISASGRGNESTDDGCCTRVYRTTFQILSVSGTITRATAFYRVTSFTRYPEGPKGIARGALGKLQLRNGIVTNTLTNVYFCSDPAWGTTGACGA